MEITRQTVTLNNKMRVVNGIHTRMHGSQACADEYVVSECVCVCMFGENRTITR